VTWAKVAAELSHHVSLIVTVATIVVGGAVKILCKVNDNVERRRSLEVAVKDTTSSDRAAVVEAYASCLRSSRQGLSGPTAGTSAGSDNYMPAARGLPRRERWR